MKLHQSDLQIFTVQGVGGNKEEWCLKVLVIFLDAIKAFYLEGGAIRERSKTNTALQTSTLGGQMLGTPAVLQELGKIKQLVQSKPDTKQRTRIVPALPSCTSNGH